MLKLLRSRRGQIRGIDFSLAIIIFTLTMGQILLLTNTFIDGNRSEIDFEERQEFADSLANQLVFSSGFDGTSQDWVNTPTSILKADSNWNIGLTTSGSVDPFKLSRLSNQSIPDVKLDYDTVRQGLNMSKNIRIEMFNSIDVEVTNFNDDQGGTITVQGKVTKSSSPVFSAEIWVYIIDTPTLNVIQAQGTSDSTGTFSIQVPLLTSDPEYYPFAVIARYGHISEDVFIDTYTRGNVQLLHNQVNVFNSTVTGGQNINVTTNMSPNLVANPTAFALYPGEQTGDLNATSQQLSIVTSNWSDDTIAIPPTHSVVVIVVGEDVDGTDLIAFVDFPVSLDGDISSPVQPLKIPSATSSSRFISVMIRGLIMDVVVTVWE
jgi:hypothetical protein